MTILAEKNFKIISSQFERLSIVGFTDAIIGYFEEATFQVSRMKSRQENLSGIKCSKEHISFHLFARKRTKLSGSIFIITIAEIAPKPNKKSESVIQDDTFFIESIRCALGKVLIDCKVESCSSKEALALSKND